MIILGRSLCAFGTYGLRAAAIAYAAALPAICDTRGFISHKAAIFCTYRSRYKYIFTDVIGCFGAQMQEAHE